jgi:hypothetical protein
MVLNGTIPEYEIDDKQIPGGEPISADRYRFCMHMGKHATNQIMMISRTANAHENDFIQTS